MKLKYPLILLSCLIMIGTFLGSCKNNSASETQENGTNMTAVDPAERIIDKEIFASESKKSGAVIVDVRMPGEFDKGHIDGAVNIDFFNPEFKHQLLDLNRKKKYYLYCKNETRSKMSMKFMQDNDFKNVFVLKGGYEEWKSSATQ